MAITKINSLAIPAGTVEPADIGYPLTNFSSTGIDDNADATAITIDSSENVGIGTTSPGTKLHIKSLVGSGGSFGGYTLLGLDSSQLTTFDILTANNSGGYINFNDNDGSGGQIGYSHPTDAMTFRTGGSERMTINSSGQLGIGTSSPNQKLHVYENALGVNIKVENNDGAYEIQKYSDDIYLNLVDTGDVIWRLGTALPERLRFTNDGSVELNGGVILLNEGATGSSSIGIKNGSSTGSQQPSVIFWGEDHSSYPGQIHIVSRSDNASYYAGDISFWDYTGSAWNQNVIFKKDGKVGIGTSDPNSLLHLGANGSTIRESINIGTNYPSTGTRTGKITWRDGANVVGQLDTSYDGTAVAMTIGSLYHGGYSTADVMRIDPRGVTKPKNPAFYAQHTSSTATSLIPFSSESYDVGSNYNPTNYRFTAPVAGYYFFYVSTLTLYATNGDTRIAFYKNGSIYRGSRHITDKYNWDTSHAACLIDCSANDYIEAKMFGLPTNGAVYGDAGYNQFFGFLVS